MDEISPTAHYPLITDPQDAVIFAKTVIKGRWTEAEPYIQTNVYYLMDYITEVIKERCIEFEDIILQNPFESYWYAIVILKTRWYEAENIILTDVEATFRYARDIIGERWKAGEEFLKKQANNYSDPVWLYLYTVQVVRERWEEVEPILKKVNRYESYINQNVSDKFQALWLLFLYKKEKQKEGRGFYVKVSDDTVGNTYTL
jgi:hypothetical protein